MRSGADMRADFRSQANNRSDGTQIKTNLSGVSPPYEHSTRVRGPGPPMGIRDADPRSGPPWNAATRVPGRALDRSFLAAPPRGTASWRDAIRCARVAPMGHRRPERLLPAQHPVHSRRL